VILFPVNVSFITFDLTVFDNLTFPVISLKTYSTYKKDGGVTIGGKDITHVVVVGIVLIVSIIHISQQ
jgi:hypothetical protein